ncbi:cation:proton antiporter [Stackebrandtia soli]|uniref:cation:proton antiporter n=1 Tax=Stackebrandtia soli TaxID=1892856 RepID=UPI0039E72BCE
MSLTELSATFFMALAVIVVACRIMHALCKKIGQPPVVGEMIAGVLLGPSLLGLVAPQVQDWIFPEEVLSTIGVVSQLGLVLYMFTVGLEFPTDGIKRFAGPGMAVSAGGIIIPIALGFGFVYLADGAVPLFPDGISIEIGAMYVGLLLAITAFPMLARIISERGESKTRYGLLSLAAGALDDVLAWVLLAVALALAGSGTSGGAMLAGGGFVLLIVVLLILRPILARTLPRLSQEKIFAVAAVILLISAWFTDMIGIHAIFGGFALGAVIPRGAISERLIEVIRPMTVGLLLPLFFTFSGLRTDFGLLGTSSILVAGAALVVVAFAGKLGACALTARAVGESWTDSLRIGLLMNARGLIQLIALNIGLQAGLITSTTFALVVVVAIVTTLAASPGLSLVDRWARRRGEEIVSAALDSSDDLEPVLVNDGKGTA